LFSSIRSGASLLLGLGLALLLAPAGSAESPRITIRAGVSLPLGQEVSGSIGLEWERATAEIAWRTADGRGDLALASHVQREGIELNAKLANLLSTPSLITGVGVTRGPLTMHADATIPIASRAPSISASSIALDLRPSDELSVATRLRQESSTVTTIVNASADLTFGRIAFRRMWTPAGEWTNTYTLDLPSAGLGVTRTVHRSDTESWVETSWHPIYNADHSVESSSPRIPAAFSAGYTPLERPNCGTCSVIRPAADSDDQTIDFGEAMIGDSSENALILNCPYYIFCWLSSVTDSPSSPFAITYAPIGVSIPNGHERRLELAFSPTTPGTYRDSMTIRYCVAYWIEVEDDEVYMVDDVEQITHHYTYRCGSYTFPLAGIALAKPEARASYSPSGPICGKDVTFDGSGSFDPNPEGAIVAYHWDFGDGTTSTLDRPTHRFASAGTYDVQLTVQNNREMSSDPLTIPVEVSLDLLEAAATIGAAAAAGWATQASAVAAPLLAAAVPGAALAVSSIVAGAGAAAFPIDQLVIRFPRTWDFQDVQQLIAREIPGAEVIGFFSSLGAFLIHLPLTTDSIDAAEAELAAAQATLAKILPPGTKLGKNYIGRFEGTAFSMLHTDIEILDADFRMAYETVRAPEAWRQIAAADIRLRPVRVAIIDTGIDATHDEFTIPLRGRSYVVEQAGSRPWYEDETGHGTQIGGIIGAENGQGRLNGMLTGCAGQYEMQVYRVIGDMFSVWDSLRIAVSRAEEELSALSAAVEAGTRRKSVVVNVSLGWDLDALPEGERVLARRTFTDLFSSFPDTLFVSSAGNGDRPDDLGESTGKALGVSDSIHAPGGLVAENNLTVAATDAAGEEFMSWSNYGLAVDIAAPGCEVYTTKRDGEYTWRVEGSSYAAAMVSGAAAAVRSIDPKLKPAEVKEILMSSLNRVRAPDGRLIPVLDFADAVSRATEGRIRRNRNALWWAAGAATAILSAGLLILRPF